MVLENESQFHESELAVQKQVGVAEAVAKYSEGFIRAAMPDQHRIFFNQLPFVMLGILDQRGYPWAMPLFGEPGFIQSPSDQSLILDAKLPLEKRLKLDMSVGQKIGILGIEWETRRRNRVNGVIDQLSDDGFSISVEQSFGNCPQYIQTRMLSGRERDHMDSLEFKLNLTESIGADSKHQIETADTFFIASRTARFHSDPRSGIDVSHRGGKPGFVKVEGNRLLFPDFRGNRFFNTLGNIESDGRVGVFFPDFVSGAAVFAVGKAQILWDDDATKSIKGAERLVEIEVQQCLYLEEFLALAGDTTEFSPVLERTGVWPHMSGSSLS